MEEVSDQWSINQVLYKSCHRGMILSRDPEGLSLHSFSCSKNKKARTVLCGLCRLYRA